jgi:hypothetical protein
VVVEAGSVPASSRPEPEREYREGDDEHYEQADRSPQRAVALDGA